MRRFLKEILDFPPPCDVEEYRAGIGLYRQLKSQESAAAALGVDHCGDRAQSVGARGKFESVAPSIGTRELARRATPGSNSGARALSSPGRKVHAIGSSDNRVLLRENQVVGQDTGGGGGGRFVRHSRTTIPITAISATTLRIVMLRSFSHRPVRRPTTPPRR